MDVRELVGKAVVSLDDAARLGRASDVIFDTERLRVAGLRVSDDAGGFVLPFDQIANIGPDAITVERADQIPPGTGASRFSAMPGIGDIDTLKVVDESGTFQGTIKTLHADPTTGDVTTLELAKGGVLGLGAEHDSLPVGAVRSVGRDVVTVRSTARPGRTGASDD